jgi:WD40 repeat protein
MVLMPMARLKLNSDLCFECLGASWRTSELGYLPPISAMDIISRTVVLKTSKVLAKYDILSCASTLNQESQPSQTALTRSPRDRLLAIYGDGAALEWNIRHPRKIESRPVAAQVPRRQATLGILRNGYSWMREPRTVSFVDTSQSGEVRQIARFPVKDSYRFELLADSDMLVVEDLRDDAVRVLMIDLERQGVIKTLETSSVTLCAVLAEDALVLDDRRAGLRMVRWSGQHDSMDLLSGAITCLSSICLHERRHILVCGQNDGMLHAWVVDLRRTPFLATKILANRIHEGMVTTVTFLDASRVVSGGRDRAIVVTRINNEGQTLAGTLERKLQLTLRCKGMRIKGLGGVDERRKLNELIAKAEAKAKIQ